MAFKGFVRSGPVHVYVTIPSGGDAFFEAYSSPGGQSVYEWVRPPAQRHQIDAVIADGDVRFRVEYDVSVGNVATISVEQSGAVVASGAETTDGLWTFTVLP